MPVFLDTDRTPEQAVHSNALHIGLINNMPDGALQATERQFIKLLESASDGITVRLSLYAIPEIPRAEWGCRRISRFYSSVDSLWDTRLDGLIVTGTEPISPQLSEEPYWRTLTRIFNWAENNTNSTICSCLAAHAAILHLDGIARHRLNHKRFGVFKCSQVSDHAFTAGVPSFFHIPHSRWNDIREADLAACGYRILTCARDGGVDAFLKQQNSLFVFLQGHPEYEANTLLLEYRRDIGRYLRRERDTYPQIPRGYFDFEAVRVMAALQEKAMSDRRQELLLDFPMARLEERIKNRWRGAGAHLYRNWLVHLRERKITVRAIAIPGMPPLGAFKPATGHDQREEVYVPTKDT
jgi:homoserine O-succinyltransferase